MPVPAQQSVFSRLWDSFSIYESKKYILVRDPLLSSIYRLIQLGVLCYIILWQMWYQNGYQRRETFTGINIFIISLIGQATIKVKGNAMSNSGRFFDAIDLVIPPQEEGGVFITTNYVHTPHQRLCDIPGVDKKGKAPAEISEVCTDEVTKTCPENRMTANGISTGRCKNNTITNKLMCEITTWCDLEDDEIGRVNILSHTGNFTVFIRIDGRYPSYPYNPISNVDTSLVYNLNLFYLSDISAAGALRGNPLTVANDNPKKLDYKYFNETVEKGQIILIAFTFDCNLDFNLNKCKPKIAFQRIDDSDFSSGFNFRYSTKYYVNGEEQRDLWKIYGIKIIVTIDGIGREFDLVTLLTALGSGIGLLKIASVVCNSLLRFFIKEDSIYNRKYDDTYLTENSIVKKYSRQIFSQIKRSLIPSSRNASRTGKCSIDPGSTNDSKANDEDGEKKRKSTEKNDNNGTVAEIPEITPIEAFN